MRERITNEIIIVVSLLIFLVLAANPWHFWMPDILTYGFVFGLLLLITLFAGVAFRGVPEDEREEFHLGFASKIGYFAGVSILVLGIATNIPSGAVNPWLAGTLLAMVIGKVSAHAWAKLRR